MSSAALSVPVPPAEPAPLFAHARGDISVSFEFFPPKTDPMNEALWRSIEMLAPLNPRFVSVTYGAGGSTRERTHQTVSRIVRETNLAAAAHLTCVDASRKEIDEIARSYWEAGVRHIVALRGDPPEEGRDYCPHPDGYAGAADLVAGLKRIAPFEISVACYPEVHPQANCPDSDLENLKRKIDAGATRAISQFFFSAENFFRFRDRAAAAGIDAGDRAGHPPVSNVAQTRQVRRPVRGRDPGLDGRDVRRPRRASRRAPADRRHHRRRTVRPALRRRRPPLPLLHLEQGRTRLCHLPPARRPCAPAKPAQALK
jgi:methylenetetrahydrofolate reductase (NADPH)